LEEKARLYVCLSIVTSVAGLMFSAYLVVIRGQGAEGWVLGFVAGNILALILFTIAAIPNFSVRPKRAVIVQLLRVGIPLAPSAVILLALAQGNRLILEKVTDIETVGVYTVGFGIGQAMNLFVGGVTTAWYPFFMERLKDLEANRVQFQRILRAYLVTGGVIALLFFVFSRPIVMILADDAFFTAHLVIGFSALAVLFTGLFSILLPGMYAANETRFVFLIQGVALLVSVGINVLFVRLLDPLIGAGIALAISYIALVALQLLWNRCRGYLKLTLTAGEVAKMSTLALAIVIATFAIAPKSLGATLLASVGIGLVTVVMGYFCFPKSDRNKLLQQVGRILRPNLSAEG
jgi:O-antigen/teichoic acid export membrane protein